MILKGGFVTIFDDNATAIGNGTFQSSQTIPLELVVINASQLAELGLVSFSQSLVVGIFSSSLFEFACGHESPIFGILTDLESVNGTNITTITILSNTSTLERATQLAMEFVPPFDSVSSFSFYSGLTVVTMVTCVDSDASDDNYCVSGDGGSGSSGDRGWQ